MVVPVATIQTAVASLLLQVVAAVSVYKTVVPVAMIEALVTVWVMEVAAVVIRIQAPGEVATLQGGGSFFV